MKPKDFANNLRVVKHALDSADASSRVPLVKFIRELTAMWGQTDSGFDRELFLLACGIKDPE